MMERSASDVDSGPESLEETLVRCGRELVVPKPVTLTSSALLAALRRPARHIFTPTSPTARSCGRCSPSRGATFSRRSMGTPSTSHLRARVLERYLAGNRRAACAQAFRRRPRGTPSGALALLPYLYTMVSGWIGNDIASSFAGGRAWEVGLQLHMGALSDLATAKALGRALRAIIPSCFVKVPFRPHEPQSLLIARDLEAEGIPVNFTSTFSARQVVAAALSRGQAQDDTKSKIS